MNFKAISALPALPRHIKVWVLFEVFGVLYMYISVLIIKNTAILKWRIKKCKFDIALNTLTTINLFRAPQIWKFKKDYDRNWYGWKKRRFSLILWLDSSLLTSLFRTMKHDFSTNLPAKVHLSGSRSICIPPPHPFGAPHSGPDPPKM